MSITNPNIIMKQNIISDLNAYVDESLTEYKSDKITTFKNFAFRNHRALKVINCPNVISIPSNFVVLPSINSLLEELCLPSLQSIPKSLTVYNQKQLKKVVFTSATKIDDDATSMFSFAQTSLEYADFSSLINVTRGSSSTIFYQCKNLHTVLLDSAETFAAETFRECESLVTVNLPKLKLLINGLFSSCKSLISVNLPEVTGIAGANDRPFYECTSLVEINVPKIADISMIFGSLPALTTIELPSVTKIPQSAFAGSTKFNTLILSGNNVVPLDNIDAFTGTGITATAGFIRVPSGLVSTYKSATNWKTFTNRIFAIE